MRYIKNGKIIMPDGEINDKVLVFSGKIVDLIDEDKIGVYGFGDVYDAEGGIIAPGFVDLHIHGYMGEDSSDGIEKGLLDMAEAITQNGVTSWLPTTMTLPLEQLEKVFDVIRGLMEKGHGGARIAGGVYAESGPYG